MKRVNRACWLRQLSHLMAPIMFALAPLFVALATAEAQPPDHAPAWGYRNKKGKGKGKSGAKHRRDRDDDYDDDEDDDFDRRNRRRDSDFNRNDRSDRRITLVGVVREDLSGNRFELRSDNGRTYLVRARNGEPGNLDRGDRVRVRGFFDGNVLVADDVRLIGNFDRDFDRDDRFGRQITLTGVVTNDLSGDQFLLRSDNGRTYRVVFHRNVDEPQGLSEGDRVRVRGHYDRDILVAHDVDILRNRDRDDFDRDNPFGGTRTVRGIVTNDLQGDQFVLRADNGRTYRVVFHRNIDEPNGLSEGDRVQVRGHLDRDVLVAHDVDILDNR